MSIHIHERSARRLFIFMRDLESDYSRLFMILNTVSAARLPSVTRDGMHNYSRILNTIRLRFNLSLGYDTFGGVGAGVGGVGAVSECVGASVGASVGMTLSECVGECRTGVGVSELCQSRYNVWPCRSVSECVGVCRRCRSVGVSEFGGCRRCR